MQWPTKAFADARSPFLIGLVGPSALRGELGGIAKTKTIGERPIRIREISAVGDIAGCQILFIPTAVEPQTQAEVVRRCRGSPILLVAETRDFIGQGGMVALAIEQNKVRVYVNLKAAQREGLQISAKLLQVAQVVD